MKYLIANENVQKEGREVTFCATIRTRIQMSALIQNLSGIGGPPVTPAWEARTSTPLSEQADQLDLLKWWVPDSGKDPATVRIIKMMGTPHVNLWPPHEHTQVCSCTHTCMCTYTHTHHVYTHACTPYILKNAWKHFGACKFFFF